MVKIVTLAFNRPDFIELQLNSIKKWVKDFQYVVYDNCPDNSIKDECEHLGVMCIPIKIFSADPSWCVGLSLDMMWKGLKYEVGQLVYLDSDMFLTAKLPDMTNYNFAFVPQERENIKYPWTGLMIFNMDTLPHPEQLEWRVDYSVKGADVGGLNHFYLEEHNPKILELEMLTLIDEGEYGYNGKESYGIQNHLEIEKLAKDNEFPHPYSFDLFHVKGDKSNKTFVFHYKSASNYPEFYTPEYNKLKTKALCKLLM